MRDTFFLHLKDLKMKIYEFYLKSLNQVNIVGHFNIFEGSDYTHFNLGANTFDSRAIYNFSKGLNIQHCSTNCRTRQIQLPSQLYCIAI